MITLQILSVIVSLLFLVLLAGIELSFTFSNKPHLEILRRRGVYSGEMLPAFFKNPAGFISTILTGTTLGLVLYTLSITSVLDVWLRNLIAALPPVINHEIIVLLLQISIALAVVIIVVEILPKSLFLINPEKFALFFSLPMRAIYFVVYPLALLVTAVSKFVLVKIFRLSNEQIQPAFGLTDLDHHINSPLVEEVKQPETEIDTKIFTNALNFKTKRVRECMIPRTEITAVEIGDGIEKLRNTFVKSGHSKILVYRETIDDIVGYCHALELFKKPKDITHIISPIIIVAETTLVHELLFKFTNERKSLALVVDEFGGTSGLISLEDVMEQIFGEIQDEYDQSEDWVEQKIDNQTFLLSARHEVDYLNEKYGWELPEGDYETLGGLIIAINKDIPSVNDVIEVLPYTFTIIAMQDARIDTVRLTITPESNEPDKLKKTPELT
jgi:putative hemolysin